MALNNATERFRLLVVHGRRYRYVDRYETWIQFRSRPVLARVDMRPLAEQLTTLESREVIWSGGDPGGLSPELSHDGESTLDPATVHRLVIDHLS
jgi:hypothetical protein